MTYDFSGLTLRQKELLTFQGWHVDCGRQQPGDRTVKKLIERGLVVESERNFGGCTVKEYAVPIPVHMAWCQRCVQGW